MIFRGLMALLEVLLLLHRKLRRTTRKLAEPKTPDRRSWASRQTGATRSDISKRAGRGEHGGSRVGAGVARRGLSKLERRAKANDAEAG